MTTRVKVLRPVFLWMFNGDVSNGFRKPNREKNLFVAAHPWSAVVAEHQPRSMDAPLAAGYKNSFEAV